MSRQAYSNLKQIITMGRITMPNGPLTLQELAELNNNLEDMNKKVEEFDNLQKELELVKAELGMFKKDDTNGGTDKPE